MLDWVFLSPLRRYSEVALFILRLFIGGFLLWSVWSKISEPKDAAALVTFLSRNNMPVPEVLAQLSIWSEFTVALAFLMGLFTRWAGVLCGVNFAAAFLLIIHTAGLRAAFPPACLALADSLFEAQPAASAYRFT
jgi:putative oxidoreductase